MRPSGIGMCLAIASLLGASVTGLAEDAGMLDLSPIYGVALPEGYRQWSLVAPALEGAPLDELRAVVGNDIAVRAYRDGTLPFPDGSILVKLAWHREPSPAFEPASVPGQPTTVQVMVKDSRRYAASGGWGSGDS